MKNTFLFVTLFLFTDLASALLNADSALSTRNGIQRNYEKSIVSLVVRGESGVEPGLCSGTLIAPDVVLTAAHCFSKELNPTMTSVEIHFGPDLRQTLMLSEGSMIRGVHHVVTHPEYDSKATFLNVQEEENGVVKVVRKRQPAYDHDLALVFMMAPAPAGIEPMPLIGPREIGPGTKLTVYGYGRARDYGTVHMPMGEIDKTHTLQRGEFVIAGTAEGRVYTTKDSRTSVCHGDSGGPSLVLSSTGPALAAVTSATMGEVLTAGFRRCLGPSVVTPLFSYRSWIDSVLRGSL